MKRTELTISAVALIVAMMAVTVFGTPSFIHYQGVLEQSGNPVPNGTYTVIFRIWNALEDGDSIWGETHQITTHGNNGKFNVQLGSVDELAPEIFDDINRWIGIEVYPDGEMTPRSQMGSVPFAFMASTVADTAIDSTKIAQKSIRGDNIKDRAIGKDKLDTLAVGKGKIEDKAVGKGQLDTLAVGKGKIEDKAVGKNQLDTLAVGKGKIEDRAIGKKQLDTLAVGKGKIEDKAVGKDQLDTLAVDEGRIKNAAVTTEKIADYTIQFVDIDTNGATTGDVMKWDGIGWSALPDEVGYEDNDWALVGEVLFTVGEWGIARAGANLYGDHDSTHVNLGVRSTTGDPIGGNSKYATVAGGIENEARGERSAVGGGGRNKANSQYAIVGGGENNEVNDAGWSGTIAGGSNNFVMGDYAAVGGGYGNSANGTNSTVCGGGGNVAIGQFSVVSGGGGLAGPDPNEARGEYSVVAGGRANHAGEESSNNYATVSGGEQNQAVGMHSTVGGGKQNTASSPLSTVSGGFNNTASGGETQEGATVGGGANNTASAYMATVGGGLDNSAVGSASFVGGGESNIAMGYASTISGGAVNSVTDDFGTICGGGNNVVANEYSSVSGGYDNSAIGPYSHATGSGAKANHAGSVVIAAHIWGWGPPNQDSVRTGGGSQMVLRADSLFYLTNTGEMAPANSPNPGGKFLDTSTGAYLSKGGMWQNSSSAGLKENFVALDGEDILNRLRDLAITRWNYKVDGEQVNHIGPVAEEFFAAFGLGADDGTISTIDPSGVALAALQELLIKSEERESRIKELETELKEMKVLLQELLAKQR
ncbi:MAG: hypothetical protein KKG33_06095 [candidate division Zixibacteria bacterium]|nr:hypothetical protein [candidate division Zixibacteria bacterium]MBU1469598.1 hypothetical protein [candidate division Zixibacteria bacterium]MBU2625113.1 hypothetical protein [candidate division Zixibacteria bacterium]